MTDQSKRKWLFFGVGGVVTLLGLWFALRLLNPLAGVWEDDGTVCSFGLFGGGECANERGERFNVGVRLGSNEMTFGDYTGTYEMLPGGGSFLFKASDMLEGVEPVTAAEPRSWREHEDGAQASGRYLGSGTMQGIRKQYAGDFQRKFSRK